MVRLSSGLLLATAVGGLALLAFQIAVLMAVVDIGVPPLSEEMIKNKVTPEEAYHTSLTLEWLRVAGTFLIVAAGPLLAWLTWRGRQLARKLTFWFAAFVFVLGAIMMISTRDDTQNLLLPAWADAYRDIVPTVIWPAVTLTYLVIFILLARESSREYFINTGGPTEDRWDLDRVRRQP